jgi:hypothetical protein
MIRIALQLEDASILNLSQEAAAPDAHFAHARKVTIAAGIQEPGKAGGFSHPGWKKLFQGKGTGSNATNFKEVAAGY